MIELDIAKEWGLTPWQYDSLDSTEKAEMMAYTWVSRLTESYHFEKSTKSDGAGKERQRA